MDDEVSERLPVADAHRANVYVPPPDPAHERAAHAARLRMELAQSAHEQRDYLRKVERSRIQREKEERRVQRGLPQEPAQDTFTFQQRAPVYHDVRDQRARQRAPKQADPAMDQVLDQIL